MQEFDPQYESDYLDNITGDDDMDNTVQKPNIFSVGDLLDMDLKMEKMKALMKMEMYLYFLEVFQIIIILNCI